MLDANKMDGIAKGFIIWLSLREDDAEERADVSRVGRGASAAGCGGRKAEPNFLDGDEAADIKT